jgi:hypothetical protein
MLKRLLGITEIIRLLTAILFRLEENERRRKEEASKTIDFKTPRTKN